MTAPTTRARFAAALAVALCSAWVLTSHTAATQGFKPDVDMSLFAARAMLGGRDPYPLVGPGREYDLPWLLLYPLTAAAAVLPLAWLPLAWARAAFYALGAVAFVMAATHPTHQLTRGRAWWAALPVFASLAWREATHDGQWTPLLAAGLVYPWLAAFGACKPNTGLAVVLARLPSRRTAGWAAAGGVLLGLVALAFVPHWPRAWLATLGGAGHVTPPILRPWGVLALLALLRWRRPEARLLLAFACLPGTPTLYESLPLVAFVPRTLPQMLALVACERVGYMATIAHMQPIAHGLDTAGIAALWYRTYGPLQVLSVYLPCVLMVLRRPNEGAVEGNVPAWLAPHRYPAATAAK